MSGPAAAVPAGLAGPAVTWLGHATVLIELDGVRLITDPLLGSRVGFLTRTGGAVDPAAVADIDAVLLSHLHADHAHVRSLRALGTGLPVLAPAGSRRWLAGKGFTDVRELAAGQELELGGVHVRATPASHSRGRWRGGGGPAPIGFLVSGSQTVYFAGDTDLFAEMEQMAGTVDLALLPISGWGRTLGSGHLDPARAAQATAMIAPRVGGSDPLGHPEGAMAAGLPGSTRRPRAAVHPAGREAGAGERGARPASRRAPGAEHAPDRRSA